MDITDVPEGNVSAVLDWVGDDLARCDLAILAEESGKQRGTLLASLGSLRKALAESAEAAAVEDHSRDVGADAAQVASQPDPSAEGAQPVFNAVQAEKDNPPCPEHFPGGWGADVITRTELVTGVRQPSVTCEHGVYERPAEK